MDFDKDTLYRLTELDGCFVIGHKDLVIPKKTARPLLIADQARMVDYLASYLHERAVNGKDYREAHELALHYVGVTTMIKPERPL